MEFLFPNLASDPCSPLPSAWLQWATRLTNPFLMLLSSGIFLCISSSLSVFDGIENRAGYSVRNLYEMSLSQSSVVIFVLCVTHFGFAKGLDVM